MLDNETIDGSNGYKIVYMQYLTNDMISVNPDSVEGDIFIFDKNGIRYKIEVKGKGKQHRDISAVFQITTSFKVS